MIKKLLLLSSAVFALNLSLSSQNFNVLAGDAPPIASEKVIDVTAPCNVGQSKTSSMVYTDTLQYFYNKHRYRNTTANQPFYYALSPMTGTLQFSHFGCRFINTGNLSVTGLQCIAARHGSSPSTGVTIRMYLCNVTTGGPVFPPIDSLNVVATGTGGSFLGANWPTPKVVTGDYAVLFKCIPTLPGDSAKLYMNNAMTATSSASPERKFGESLAFIRYNGNFYSTTNLYGATAPSGTDYEYQVAPRIQFTGTTSQSSANLAALCTNTAYTFNNTSTDKLGHRQYNLNEFYRKWKPFANPNASFNPDSVFTFSFTDGSPDRFTASGVNSINKTFQTVGTYSVILTSKYKKMISVVGDSSQIDKAFASKTTSNCAVTNTTSTVGLTEVAGFENLNVYPNPSVNGKTTISGLTGTNTIMVYDILGQVVLTQRTEKDIINLDLANKANGNYIIKIINSSHHVKVLKVVNQN